MLCMVYCAGLSFGRHLCSVQLGGVVCCVVLY